MDRFTNRGETPSKRQELRPKPKYFSPTRQLGHLQIRAINQLQSGMVTQHEDDKTHASGILSSQFCDLAITYQYLVRIRSHISASFWSTLRASLEVGPPRIVVKTFKLFWDPTFPQKGLRVGLHPPPVEWHLHQPRLPMLEPTVGLPQGSRTWQLAAPRPLHQGEMASTKHCYRIL